MLVLGSFPSVASLEAGCYYAHPQNQFWPILGAVTGVPLQQLDYADRLSAVKAAGIAIWDAYASCMREGSLDAAIRAAEPNDFAVLKKSAPALRRICCNGLAAARRLRELQGLGYDVVVLPSTSPANAAMRFEQKLARWRTALLDASPRRV